MHDYFLLALFVVISKSSRKEGPIWENAYLREEEISVYTRR